MNANGALKVKTEQAERRADELVQMSDFQARQISEVDAEMMGATIRNKLLERTRFAGMSEGKDEEELAQQQVALEALIVGVDFTGISLGALEEHFFERALHELRDLDDQPHLQAKLLDTVAVTLRDLGLLERAVEPQRRAVELYRSEFGVAHPDTLASFWNICYK